MTSLSTDLKLTCDSVGTSVEHHVLYQYHFVNTKDAVMGQIQTESP